MSDLVAGTWDVKSAAAYHGDRTCVSHSALECFRASRPQYHGRYVTGKTAPSKPTASMVLGSALDCWLLQPDLFRHLFHVAPLGLTRRHKQWDELESVHAGKTLLLAEDFLAVERMAESVMANRLARSLISGPGKSQQAIRWEHQSGVWCKAMFDRQLDDGPSVDLKTTLDPSPAAWARQAHRLGYHRQAALYIDGRQEALGIDVSVEFLHVVVRNDEPWECVVLELDIDAIALGQAENRADLQDLRQCREFDRWQTPWHDAVNTISFPRYCFPTPEEASIP